MKKGNTSKRSAKGQRSWSNATKSTNKSFSINYTGMPSVSLGSMMDNLLVSSDMQKALQQWSDKQNVKPLDPTPTKRGDYDTIERIDFSTKSKSNLANRTLLRKFGAPEDYIQLHIYNSKGDLLDSVNEVINLLD